MNKIIQPLMLFLTVTFLSTHLFAQQKGEPFEGIDQTWQNGSDRRDSSVFKKIEYFVPSIFVDVNYTHSFKQAK